MKFLKKTLLLTMLCTIHFANAKQVGGMPATQQKKETHPATHKVTPLHYKKVLYLIKEMKPYGADGLFTDHALNFYIDNIHQNPSLNEIQQQALVFTLNNYHFPWQNDHEQNVAKMHEIQEDVQKRLPGMEAKKVEKKKEETEEKKIEEKKKEKAKEKETTVQLPEEKKVEKEEQLPAEIKNQKQVAFAASDKKKYNKRIVNAFNQATDDGKNFTLSNDDNFSNLIKTITTSATKILESYQSLNISASYDALKELFVTFFNSKIPSTQPDKAQIEDRMKKAVIEGLNTFSSKGL